MDYTNEEKNQTDNLETEQSERNENTNDTASQDVTNENFNDKEANMAENNKKSDEKKQEKKTTPDDSGLASGVTLEPQDENHADLRDLSNPIEVSKVSVPVDDDKGDFTGDKDGFKQLQDFIATNKNKKESDLKDTELLESGTKLALTFDDKVALQAAISLGIINKYRLMLGMLLNILKTSFEEINADDKNASWMKYYESCNFKFSLSSAEKYMKLAKIQNIIRWAFLGLERLEAINTVIQKNKVYKKMKDPVAGFFRDSDIAIEFEDEDLENWKDAIDAAVADNKIKMHFEKENINLPENKKVEDTVDRTLVADLISGGINCSPGLIHDLFLWAKGGSDPDEILSDLLMRGGKSPSKQIKENLTETRAIEGFLKIKSILEGKVKVFEKNNALLSKVKLKDITDIQKQVTALRNLVKNQSKK